MSGGPSNPFPHWEETPADDGSFWSDLRGARIFITGGTGFVGRCLLEGLLWADRRFRLSIRAVLLTRDPAGFRRRNPVLGSAAGVGLLKGDVRSFRPPFGAFSHMIHAANDSSVRRWAQAPRAMAEIVIEGTRRTLEFADRAGVGAALLVSSGAVYGPQPARLARIPEDFRGGPDPLLPASAYAEAKRLAEQLCALHAGRALKPKIARCFAFMGPYLPLDEHFAAGNFLRDALRGGPIQVRGDGTPWRSYLYSADMAWWLWTILLRGKPLRAYNVGSERPIRIVDLARLTRRLLAPEAGVRIARRQRLGAASERYVPSTRRARSELGLRETVPIEEALRRAARWHRAQGENHEQ